MTKHKFTIDGTDYERSYVMRGRSDKLVTTPPSPLYKIVRTDLGAAHGGKGKWAIGEWWIVGDGKHDQQGYGKETTTIQACANGLHLTTKESLSRWLTERSMRLFEVEVAGPVIDNDDKFVAGAAKLVREIPVDETLMHLLQPRMGQRSDLDAWSWDARQKATEAVGRQQIYALVKARYQRGLKRGVVPAEWQAVLDPLFAADQSDSKDGRLPEGIRTFMATQEAQRKLLGARSQLLNAEYEYATATGDTEGAKKALEGRTALTKERETQRKAYGVFRLNSDITWTVFIAAADWYKSRQLRADFDRAVLAHLKESTKPADKSLTLDAALARTVGKTKRGV